MPATGYQPGDLIAGRYEVHFVKKGGMGVVHLCLDRETIFPYAIKIHQETHHTAPNARGPFTQ